MENFKSNRRVLVSPPFSPVSSPMANFTPSPCPFHSKTRKNRQVSTAHANATKNRQ